MTTIIVGGIVPVIIIAGGTIAAGYFGGEYAADRAKDWTGNFYDDHSRMGHSVIVETIEP